MGYLEIPAFLISSHILWGNLNPSTALWKGKKCPNCSRNRSQEMHDKHARNREVFMTNLSLYHLQYTCTCCSILPNFFTQWPDVFHDAAHVVTPETTANEMCHLLIKWQSKRGCGQINLMYWQLFTKGSIQICHSGMDGRFITVSRYLQCVII